MQRAAALTLSSETGSSPVTSLSSSEITALTTALCAEVRGPSTASGRAGTAGVAEKPRAVRAVRRRLAVRAEAEASFSERGAGGIQSLSRAGVVDMSSKANLCINSALILTLGPLLLSGSFLLVNDGGGAKPFGGPLGATHDRLLGLLLLLHFILLGSSLAPRGAITLALSAGSAPGQGE